MKIFNRFIENHKTLVPITQETKICFILSAEQSRLVGDILKNMNLDCNASFKNQTISKQKSLRSMILQFLGCVLFRLR